MNKTQKKQVPFFVRERETKIKHKKIPRKREGLWIWSGKRGSNSRPRPWQGRALPTELFPHWVWKLERETRLELATPTLARSCSTNWAIPAFTSNEWDGIIRIFLGSASIKSWKWCACLYIRRFSPSLKNVRDSKRVLWWIRECRLTPNGCFVY